LREASAAKVRRTIFIYHPNSTSVTACAILMSKLFAHVKGSRRLPRERDSLIFLFDESHHIQQRIQDEYAKPIYDRKKRGDFLKARNAIIKEVKNELSDKQRSQLGTYHLRRCERWKAGFDAELPDDADEDEDMSEEAAGKVTEAVAEAESAEDAERARLDKEEEDQEEDSVDHTSLAEYVVSKHSLFVN
jgi:hypothetical protein